MRRLRHHFCWGFRTGRMSLCGRGSMYLSGDLMKSRLLISTQLQSSALGFRSLPSPYWALNDLNAESCRLWPAGWVITSPGGLCTVCPAAGPGKVTPRVATSSAKWGKYPVEHLSSYLTTTGIKHYTDPRTLVRQQPHLVRNYPQKSASLRKLKHSVK